ncbi:MAG: addiction module protein [Planctomycetes bacterium]|nr:addiction module protein [Planctomycetota bacterium]
MATLMAKKDILKLTVDERLKLIDLIWQTLLRSEEDLPIAPEILDEMDRRLEWARANPDKCLTHDQFMQKLRGART